MKERQEDITYFNMYLKELESIPPCDEAEQDALIQKVISGDMDARNRLVEGNLYRALQIAGSYAGSGLSAADLVSEANLALTMAVEQYANDQIPAPLLLEAEPSISTGASASGKDFTAYMEQYVKASLEDYATEEKESDMAGEKLASLINRMDQVTKLLAEKLEREATLEEVSKAMEMEPEDVKVLMKMALEAASSNVPQESEEELYVDEDDSIVETEDDEENPLSW